ncbi:MAG: hypothetical protein AAFQ37_05545, partial [Bacteroidota bacterium]
MARYQKYLVYAILIYMVLAFGWWTVLLTTQTREVFDAKVERLETLRAIQQRKDKLTDDASYLALEQQ